MSQVGQDRLSELIDAEFAKSKPQHPGSSVEDLILWRRDSDCWHRKEQPLVESLAKRLFCPLQAINQKGFWSKSRVKAGRRCTVTTIEGAWKSRNPIGQYAVVTKQLHSAIAKFVRGVPLACLNDSSREHLDIGSQSLKGRFAEMTRDWREHLHLDLTVDARGWADNWQCFKRAGVFKAGKRAAKLPSMLRCCNMINWNRRQLKQTYWGVQAAVRKAVVLLVAALVSKATNHAAQRHVAVPCFAEIQSTNSFEKRIDI